MILLGKNIISNKIVTSCIDASKQVQPVGVDLTIQKIETYRNVGSIDFDNSKRQLPALSDTGRFDEFWLLKPGAYLVTFNEVVDVPPDVMGIARPRSSLLRMGATIETSVWDPGYKGRSQSMLVVHNLNGIKIYDNAKVAQIIFIKTESQSDVLYSGKYQGENLT